MTSPAQQYAQAETRYAAERQKQAQKANLVAALRLITILSLFAGAYYYFNAQNFEALAAVIIILGGVFLVLVFVHAHIKEQEKLLAILCKINQNEQAYLKDDLSAFDGGEAFVNPEHPYTYDLDMFGQLSIFQHLNRTETAFGKAELAQNVSESKASDIILRQEAIKELSTKLEWRQYFQAYGQVFADKEEKTDKFRYWIEKPFSLQNQSFLKIIAFALPVLTIVVLILNFVTDLEWTSPLFRALGILNLLMVGSQVKKIKQEHELLTNMSLSFEKYAALLKAIENESFSSQKLNQLKESIVVEGATASKALKRLSVILNQFDGLSNPFAAIIMNGLFQYHIHTMFSLQKWKQTFGQNVFQWFQVLGEFEALSSIANFSHNHPDFIFPTPVDNNQSAIINNQSRITEGALNFKNVGHPLIPKGKRIGNDVAFNDPSFVVLTGSNMSGKSTFLRTLGVNLVLAKMGAPVCADEFQFYPFNVFVSMRVSDSLQNSESFFFAELKRLKRIITELAENQKTFVILDEILRGTNSNDKRAGTIGLIHNLMKHKAVGIIATHDLVIGDMEKQYANYLKNLCFEVEIVNDELVFDYKLQHGVAQKMSAAFLMTKMGIIE
jgi:hypothetical protein